jgi:hypothetical protein
MHIDSAKILLNILIENSVRILAAGFGVNAAESSFFDVINLLRSEPTLRTHFLDKAALTFALPDSGILNADMPPQELIELVVHELKWDELQVLAHNRVKNVFSNDWVLAIADISQKVVDAKDASWADREFYSFYSKR